MADQPARVGNGRIVFAAILDFLTAFVVFGLAIGYATGQVTHATGEGVSGGGFNLTGFPAVLLLVLIVAYFVVGNRLLGGTPWKHILRVPVRR